MISYDDDDDKRKIYDACFVDQLFLGWITFFSFLLEVTFLKSYMCDKTRNCDDSFKMLVT